MALTYSVPSTELSATLANRRTTIIDNIFEKAVFMGMMRMHGGVRMESGGNTLDIPLRMAKNTAAGSFTDYDILDVTPQDTLTTAQVDWAGEYASISISWMEERRNEGRHAVFSLLQSKIDGASDTIRDNINTKLLQTQPAAGSKDIISITEWIDDTPATNPTRGTDSIGRIDASTHSFWRNQATDGGSFTVADMNTVFHDVSKAADMPTFYLTSQTIYEYYENSQVGQIRYENADTADAGFQTLQYKGRPLVWDPNIGSTDNIYYINTDYMKICIHVNGDFVTSDFVKPDNQLARVAQIAFMGQLECSNRRRVGTLYDITAPA
jgi:hypothetical protein